MVYVNYVSYQFVGWRVLVMWLVGIVNINS